MINLETENIVIEIRDLVKSIEGMKGEVDLYCDLMKQMFLTGSGKN